MKNMLSKEALLHIPSMLTIPKMGRLEIGMSRMCVMDIAGGFLTLKESLRNEIGSRGKEVLYSAGFEGGKTFLEKLLAAKRLKADESALKEALLQYSSAGFGNYLLESFNLEDGTTIIKGHDCFEAWAHKEKEIMHDDQVCDYSRGVMSGFVSAILKYRDSDFSDDIYCFEAECSVKDFSTCKFIVGLSEKLEEMGLKKHKYTQPLKNELKIKSKTLEKTIKRLKAIEDISFACSSLFTSDLSTVYGKVLKPFCELTGADYGVVLLVKNPEKQICINAVYGLSDDFMDVYNNKLKYTIDSQSVNENWPSVKSVLKKEISLVTDTEELNVGFSSFFKESISPNQIRSVASVPIVIKDVAIGTITKYYTNPHEFDDEEISFMKTTANIITSTIERNQLLDIAKKSQIELAEINDELKKKNQELDSFVYIASHDLREPLRTIESFAEIVQHEMDGKLTVEQDDYFQRIVKATHRMRKLIEDLANLSRASRNVKGKESEEVDLSILINEVQFELTAFMEKKSAVVEILGSLPLVCANKEKITSVLKNLILNGIKFNKSKKPIIKIYVDKSLNLDSGKVCICVEDNGIGIGKEYHEKIFGLFQRLHSQDEYEGTGAGLAIVKKVLEKYDCKIWIDSEEGKGSKFYLTLPKWENLNHNVQ